MKNIFPDYLYLFFAHNVNYISFEVIMDQGDKNIQWSDQNNSFTFLCPHRLCGEVVSSSVDDVTPRYGAISILAM